MCVDTRLSRRRLIESRGNTRESRPRPRREDRVREIVRTRVVIHTLIHIDIHISHIEAGRTQE